MWRVIRRLGVPPALVDDAVQEVFMVLHRRQAELDVESSIRSLLYGIARRVAKRQRDQESTRQTRIQPLSVTPDPRPNLEQRLESQRKAEVVSQALAAMDEGKRMTFVLADVEGMSIPEVARCLGINVNTAYARLRAARERMRQTIARHQAREEGDLVRTRTR